MPRYETAEQAAERFGCAVHELKVLHSPATGNYYWRGPEHPSPYVTRDDPIAVLPTEPRLSGPSSKRRHEVGSRHLPYK